MLTKVCIINAKYAAVDDTFMRKLISKVSDTWLINNDE